MPRFTIHEPWTVFYNNEETPGVVGYIKQRRFKFYDGVVLSVNEQFELLSLQVACFLADCENKVQHQQTKRKR